MFIPHDFSYAYLYIFFPRTSLNIPSRGGKIHYFGIWFFFPSWNSRIRSPLRDCMGCLLDLWRCLIHRHLLSITVFLNLLFLAYGMALSESTMAPGIFIVMDLVLLGMCLVWKICHIQVHKVLRVNDKEGKRHIFSSTSKQLKVCR